MDRRANRCVVGWVQRVMLGFALASLGSWSSGARAQLRPLQQTTAPGSSNTYTTQSVQAEVAGDHAKGLSMAEEAIKADPKDPWGHYDRADALNATRETDQAVPAFRQAEQLFPENDIWGRSVAIWGQANAYNQAGRCQEAAPIYERYAVYVEKVDPEAAALARQYAIHCTPRPTGK